MPCVSLTDAVAAPALYLHGRHELVLYPLRLIDVGAYLRRYGAGEIDAEAAWFLLWLSTRGAMPFRRIRRMFRRARPLANVMAIVFAINEAVFGQVEDGATGQQAEDLRDLCSVVAEALHKTPNELALLTPAQVLAMQKPDTDVPHFGSIEAWREWRNKNGRPK